MKPINCFIVYDDAVQAEITIENLLQSELVNAVYLLSKRENIQVNEKCFPILIDSLYSSNTIRKIAEKSDTPYSLVYLKNTPLHLGQFALERFFQIAQDTKAGMVYSDYYQVSGGVRSKLPLIDYQTGSVRDDFNFGSVLFFNAEVLKQASAQMNENFLHAGLYDARLRISQKAELVHIDEYLYSEVESDNRKSGEKLFDYVDPKNRQRQLEMEHACTEHLKNIGAYLKPQFKTILFDENNFEVEASVIIPVKNRATTIEDAVRSALTQKTSFPFNVIVVDNHSTDGTSEIVEKLAKEDSRVRHIIPQREDLGIGGCWNVAVHSPFCGKFSVQLDSDDVYQDENTLQIMVNAFYE
ncbi:MAG TPA: glycosyltransferase family A protein, partial [Paludibacteraceae bacterium]|nr:glycosyltransferase family A protein [Paludibacteraceae bacterium]